MCDKHIYNPFFPYKQIIEKSINTTSPVLKAGTAVQTMLFESISLFDKAMFIVVLLQKFVAGVTYAVTQQINNILYQSHLFIYHYFEKLKQSMVSQQSTDFWLRQEMFCLLWCQNQLWSWCGLLSGEHKSTFPGDKTATAWCRPFASI